MPLILGAHVGIYHHSASTIVSVPAMLRKTEGHMFRVLIIATSMLLLIGATPTKVYEGRLLEREGVWYKPRFEKPFSGINRERYANGQLQYEHTYKNGKWNGLERWWHPNGELWQEVTYKDGKSEGVWKLWYEDGQLRRECNYITGKRDGLDRWWWENGQLHQKHTYKNGKKQGLQQSWYSNGQLSSESCMSNGKIVDIGSCR